MTTVAVLAAPVPADAAVVTRSDEIGDTIERLDIVRVTYTNAPAQVRARIVVADLKRLGRAQLTIGQYATDVAYVSTISIDSDGNVTKKFGWMHNLGTDRRSCRGDRTTWVAGDEYVKFVVPRSCLPDLGNPNRYLLGTSMGAGDNQDWGASVQLVRG